MPRTEASQRYVCKIRGSAVNDFVIRLSFETDGTKVNFRLFHLFQSAYLGQLSQIHGETNSRSIRRCLSNAAGGRVARELCALPRHPGNDTLLVVAGGGRFG